MSTYALDIETECGLGCSEPCEHALDPYRNNVSIIGVANEADSFTFKSVDALREFLHADKPDLVMHNGKFDLHTLATKGLDLAHLWVGDTLLMAATAVKKAPDTFLWEYARKRKALNEAMPSGARKHRAGTPNSLKVLAPFWLEVEPFWENPSDHNNAEYVLKDCLYTFQLYKKLKEQLTNEGNFEFYQERLFPWTKLLLRMERRGININLQALSLACNEAAQQAAKASSQLHELWAPGFNEFQRLRQREVEERYEDLLDVALKKSTNQSKTILRYRELAKNAKLKVEPFNLGSPKQLAWLLKEYLRLDISDFHGEESTGKPVLQRLAPFNEGVQVFLNYRKQSKLVEAFFPSYLAKQVDGVMHTTFNPVKSPNDNTGEELGTAKGRLSSSNPNLQQVPKHLHHLYVARSGYKLLTYDAAAIEPRIIAYYTCDKALFDILAAGKDYHNYNTAIFFELNPEEDNFKKKYSLEREVGKEIGLALKYGAGNLRVRESAQKRGFVWSKEEAQSKIEQFKAFYKGVWKFREQVVNKALRQGPIRTLMGRPLVIEDEDDFHLKGLNQLVQVSASDLIMESAMRAQAKFDSEGLDAHILLLVHDEIVAEAPSQNAERCKEILEEAMTSYKLDTALGPIQLKVEGKISDIWEK